MTDKNTSLFGDDAVAPTDVAAPTLGGPALRVVYFDVVVEGEETVEDARPCLVRCDNGQRNIKTIRPLMTLCGRSCVTATRTSGQPPTEGVTYCNTCHSMAGNGVIG